MNALSQSQSISEVFNDYQINGYLDEVFDKNGQANSHYQKVLDQFNQYSASDFRD